jgi:hypothetical protein
MFAFQGFPPANIIFAGISVLLSVSVLRRSLLQFCFDTRYSQAGKDASASQDSLLDLFNCIEHFFHRLEIYSGITPTTPMIDIIVEIMVEVLAILAITTKELKRGRLRESMLCRFTISIDTWFREVFQEVDREHGHRG